MTIPVDTILSGVSEERRAKIKARAAELIAEHQTLAALRKGRGLTQAQVAEAMETSQANVAQIERKTDALVSTVAKIVRAMGGRLSLVAEFDDGGHVPLALAQDGTVSYREAATARPAAPASVERFRHVHLNIVPKSVMKPMRGPFAERLTRFAALHRDIQPGADFIIPAGKILEHIVIAELQPTARQQIAGQGPQYQKQVKDLVLRVARDETQSVA